MSISVSSQGTAKQAVTSEKVETPVSVPENLFSSTLIPGNGTILDLKNNIIVQIDPDDIVDDTNSEPPLTASGLDVGSSKAPNESKGIESPKSMASSLFRVMMIACSSAAVLTAGLYSAIGVK